MYVKMSLCCSANLLDENCSKTGDVQHAFLKANVPLHIQKFAGLLKKKK